jgi:hypothetical protein
MSIFGVILLKRLSPSNKLKNNLQIQPPMHKQPIKVMSGIMHGGLQARYSMDARTEPHRDEKDTKKTRRRHAEDTQTQAVADITKLVWASNALHF